MKSIALALAVLYGLFVEEYVCLNDRYTPNVTQPVSHASNKTMDIARTVPSSFNETTLANFTYTLTPTQNLTESELDEPSPLTTTQVDCFGLGKEVATILESFFMSEPNGSQALHVHFFLSSRKQPRRVRVVLGEQFGLEWTDFRMERRTVIIVPGFLSHDHLEWIKDMEKALLKWVSVGDVWVLISLGYERC